jgi:hypothetical protein
MGCTVTKKGFIDYGFLLYVSCFGPLGSVLLTATTKLGHPREKRPDYTYLLYRLVTQNFDSLIIATRNLVLSCCHQLPLPPTCSHAMHYS